MMGIAPEYASQRSVPGCAGMPCFSMRAPTLSRASSAGSSGSIGFPPATRTSCASPSTAARSASPSASVPNGIRRTAASSEPKKPSFSSRARRARESTRSSTVSSTRTATRVGTKRRTRRVPRPATRSAASRRSSRVTKGMIFTPPMRSPSRATYPEGRTYTARSSISFSRARRKWSSSTRPRCRATSG